MFTDENGVGHHLASEALRGVVHPPAYARQADGEARSCERLGEAGGSPPEASGPPDVVYGRDAREDCRGRRPPEAMGQRNLEGRTEEGHRWGDSQAKALTSNGSACNSMI